ncbi:MAG: hypothetical protein MUF10_00765 [Thermoanaerobaculaceae bacterium]|jgi:hypothetical protein|nr:hypothetical protein [Thermoanaerobaculaceae bacterium]
MARALLASGNSGQAADLLRQQVDQFSLDCESWSWLAWVELHRNEPAAAWQALQAPGCPGSQQEASRWALLEAVAQRAAGDAAGVAAALARVGDRSVMWPEDARLRAGLEKLRDPVWQQPLLASVELATGGTTNAFAGSPTDTTKQGEESLLARLNAAASLRAPRHGPVTPLVEVGVRGHGIAADEARDLSYLELAGRLGAELRLGRTTAVLTYRRDTLHLNQDHSLYSEGQRAELELELPGGLVVLAGGGHRDFQDPWRTRQELDAGVAGTLRAGGLPVTLALAGRSFDAHMPVHDQRGGTLTAVTSTSLGGAWRARLGLTVAVDDYPHSGGWEGLVAFGSAEKRHDTLARLSLGAIRRLGNGLQVGITYEHARRWSSIEEGFQGSFSYREHRLLASLRFDLDANPWRRGRTGGDHVPLDHGLGGSAGGFGEERVRDLVRQDEDLRGDCGCSPH